VKRGESMEKNIQKQISTEDWTWFSNHPDRMVRVRVLLDGEAPYLGCGVEQPYVMVLKSTNSDYLIRRGIGDIGTAQDDGVNVFGFNPVGSDEHTSLVLWEVLDQMEMNGEPMPRVYCNDYWLADMEALISTEENQNA